MTTQATTEREEAAKDPSQIRQKRMIADHFERLARAKDEGKKVVYTFVPGNVTELLLTQDILPVLPEINALQSGMRKLSGQYIAEAEKLGHSEDVCTYVKCDLGMLKSGNIGPTGTKLPEPDLLLLSYTGCFTFMKWFELLKQEYNCPVVMLHVPYQTDGQITPEMRKYVIDQIEREVIPALERVTEKKLDRDVLAHKLALSREAENDLVAVWESAQHTPSPIDGYFGGVYYIGPIFSAFRGTEDAVLYYKELRAEVEERIRLGKGPVTPDGDATEERFRLVVEGPPNWTSFLDFWRMFSREGATVVSSTYTRVGGLYDTGFRHDPKDPIGTLADYCLGCYTNLGLPTRTALLADYIKKYRADGFLINSVKSCNSFSAGQLLMLRELEKRTGVPGGFIESDLGRPTLLRQVQHRKSRSELLADARGEKAGRMKVVVGVDLGSTTTKAVLLDEQRRIVGKGITNSRSNYEVACSVAREEALTAARFTLLERALGDEDRLVALREGFRRELYLDQLEELGEEMRKNLRSLNYIGDRAALEPALGEILESMREEARRLFGPGQPRKSDFFRDLAGASFMAAAETVSNARRVRYERVTGIFDRAILDVETRLIRRDFGPLIRRAAGTEPMLRSVVEQAATQPIEEMSFVGTGYGRQTLPFPKQAVKSEILCHGRGAHRVFPGTRTVLDIGGQDTKAIQVDERGVVTGFQMNDRCAAGCGRYLGYIADELNLGLHELGPLALAAERVVKVNSTCTVFAGAELRERLGLGERREDILAGLHRSIMLRAMSLLARSGGIQNEFSFTGGVCKNPMATKVLGELVTETYGDGITLNMHSDSIYMGALGAALFGVDDLEAGRPAILPTFVQKQLGGVA